MPPRSRREFGKALVGLSVAGVVFPRGIRAANGVMLGVSTSSFRDLPRLTGRDNVDDVMRALQSVRATHVELALANIEPAPPSTAPVMGGSNAYPRRIVLSPEEVAATNAEARGALRAWRLATDTSLFAGVRAKFSAAGLTTHAVSVAYNDSFTDAEIDATFRQATTLGVKTISSPMTLATARRIAPFAERHHVSVAIHNQVDGNPSGFIATPQIAQALALSPAFTLKLDIGHLTASNCDAVSELRSHLPRVSLVCLRDRLRNGGASQVFGEGDTPIAAALGVLKASPTPIPAVVEYDYVGLRSPVEEVAASLAYATKAAQ